MTDDDETDNDGNDDAGKRNKTENGSKSMEKSAFCLHHSFKVFNFEYQDSAIDTFFFFRIN